MSTQLKPPLSAAPLRGPRLGLSHSTSGLVKVWYFVLCKKRGWGGVNLLAYEAPILQFDVNNTSYSLQTLEKIAHGVS